jgi:hypothetical protein
LINTYVYFYIFIDSSALQCFFRTQKGKAVMRNILGPICITMFVASCGGGAGTNPFDTPSNSTSENVETTPNGDNGSPNEEETMGNTNKDVASITFGGTTPPDDGSSVAYQSEENYSVIRNFGSVGDVRNEFIENDVATTSDDVHNLYIDNLAFDGLTPIPHQKDEDFGGVGRLDVYLLTSKITDPQTGAVISQNDSRTIYGASESGSTQVVVVHHLNMIDDQLKGYRYQRNQYDVNDNLVTYAPTETAQLAMAGDYLGTRVFIADKPINVFSASEYVTGKVMFELDLQDPNAFRIQLTDRERFSTTTGVSLEKSSYDYNVPLPDTIRMIVDDGVSANGEFTSTLISSLKDFESGDVYGVLATNADVILHEGAGVIILQSQDPTQFANKAAGTYEGEIDQYEEAGGFILDRNLP